MPTGCTDDATGSLPQKAKEHPHRTLLAEMSRQFSLPVIDVSALPCTLPRSLAKDVWVDDAPPVLIVDWVGGRWIFIS